MELNVAFAVVVLVASDGQRSLPLANPPGAAPGGAATFAASPPPNACTWQHASSTTQFRAARLVGNDVLLVGTMGYWPDYSFFFTRYRYSSGIWDPQSVLPNTETYYSYTINPRIAVGLDGTATVLFNRQPDQLIDYRSLYAYHYSPDLETWVGPFALDGKHDKFTRDGAEHFDVATDPAGSVLAVWSQDVSPAAGGDGESLWFNRYEPLTGWSTNPFGPTLIESGPYPTDRLKLLGNGQLHHILVWLQRGDPAASLAIQIWARRYDTGTQTWEGNSPVLLSPDFLGTVYDFDGGVDDDGNVIVVWTEFRSVSIGGDGFTSLYSSRYDAREGAWSVPLLLETLDGYEDHPALAVTSGGDAVVVWRHRVDPIPAGTLPLWFYWRYFDAETAQWNPGGPELHTMTSESSSGSYLAHLQALPDGTFHMTYTESDYGRGAVNLLNRNVLRPGQGWGPVELVLAGEAPNAIQVLALESRFSMTIAQVPDNASFVCD